MEFERSSAKYEEFKESLQRDLEGRKELLQLLEDSDAHYEVALDEAQVIANVSSLQIYFISMVHTSCLEYLTMGVDDRNTNLFMLGTPVHSN